MLEPAKSCWTALTRTGTWPLRLTKPVVTLPEPTCNCWTPLTNSGTLPFIVTNPVVILLEPTSNWLTPPCAVLIPLVRVWEPVLNLFIPVIIAGTLPLTVFNPPVTVWEPLNNCSTPETNVGIPPFSCAAPVASCVVPWFRSFELAFNCWLPLLNWPIAPVISGTAPLSVVSPVLKLLAPLFSWADCEANLLVPVDNDSIPLTNPGTFIFNSVNPLLKPSVPLCSFFSPVVNSAEPLASWLIPEVVELMSEIMVFIPASIFPYSVTKSALELLVAEVFSATNDSTFDRLLCKFWTCCALVVVVVLCPTSFRLALIAATWVSVKFCDDFKPSILLLICDVISACVGDLEVLKASTLLDKDFNAVFKASLLLLLFVLAAISFWLAANACSNCAISVFKVSIFVLVAESFTAADNWSSPSEIFALFVCKSLTPALTVCAPVVKSLTELLKLVVFDFNRLAPSLAVPTPAV